MSASISNLARDIRALDPRIAPGHFVAPSLRMRLEDLGVAAGLSEATATRANDADLIGVYLVALKSPDGARQTARKVALRLDDTLLNGTPAQPYPASVKDPQAPVINGITRPDLAEALAPLIAENSKVQAAYQALQRHADVLADKVDNLNLELVERVQAAAEAAVKALTPTRLEIVQPGKSEPHSLGLAHKDTARILKALTSGRNGRRINVYLHGPAGSGKTTVARKCAEALNLQFYFAAKVESEYQLMGFTTATGNTVMTQFRLAYQFGGCFLFDELDASSPSAVTALNAALANGICAFPDETVARHPDFYCIGAGNTTLGGASHLYTGRNQLDGASVDRFAFIEFGYDEVLERALSDNDAWCSHVQATRASVARIGLERLVTPRATIDGCDLLAAGFPWDEVEHMALFKAWEPEDIAQVRRAA